VVFDDRHVRVAIASAAETAQANFSERADLSVDGCPVN
jgi:hypothetical protein